MSFKILDVTFYAEHLFERVKYAFHKPSERNGHTGVNLAAMKG